MKRTKMGKVDFAELCSTACFNQSYALELKFGTWNEDVSRVEP